MDIVEVSNVDSLDFPYGCKHYEDVISQVLKTLEQNSEKWLHKFNAVKCPQTSIGHKFDTKYGMQQKQI